MTKSKYEVEIIDGRGYVTLAIAKKIMGVTSVKALQSHGGGTLQIDDGKPLWDVDGLVSIARNQRANCAKLSPDIEWLEQYDADWLARDERPRYELEPKKLAIAPANNSLVSSARLDRLMELAPPPKEAQREVVDWGTHEKELGVIYPASFKEFISVYSDFVWFESVGPVVPMSNESPEDFRTRVDGIYKRDFERNTEHSEVGVLIAPHFDEPKGWLPFMCGCDGDAYAWVMDGPPENWHIIKTYMGCYATILPPISITEMFVGWLLGEPLMEEVWGSIDEYRAHSPEALESPFE